MPSRLLTPSEIASLDELQDVTVAALKFLAGDDPVLLFALRRRLYTRLMHMERGKPGERRKLKREKWAAQGGLCALCGESMERHGSELDRHDPVLGYTAENTRLVHHACHLADQRAKGYGDGRPAREPEPVQPPSMRTRSSQRDMMRALHREHRGDEASVCAAYAEAEIAGRVLRKRNASAKGPEAYAAALWRDGVAKGWMSS